MISIRPGGLAWWLPWSWIGGDDPAATGGHWTGVVVKPGERHRVRDPRRTCVSGWFSKRRRAAGATTVFTPLPPFNRRSGPAWGSPRRPSRRRTRPSRRRRSRSPRPRPPPSVEPAPAKGSRSTPVPSGSTARTICRRNACGFSWGAAPGRVLLLRVGAEEITSPKGLSRRGRRIRRCPISASCLGPCLRSASDRLATAPTSSAA